MLSLRFSTDQIIKLTRPLIMGIVNVSPYSFYRPHLRLDSALYTVEKMINEGTDIIDIGGEATNPNVIDLIRDDHDCQMEMDRVLPLVEAVCNRFDILVSVDTSLVSVMVESVRLGADMINDQRALSAENAKSVIADLKVPVCLMHFFNPVRQPNSSDCATLLADIKEALWNTIQDCEQVGITKDRIIIDPGFGQGHYGKSAAENYYLLHYISAFVQMGYPVLSGWSRKSMIGDVLSQPATDRLFGSIAADVLATYQGASIIRTHDVRAASEATRIAYQVKLAAAY